MVIAISSDGQYTVKGFLGNSSDLFLEQRGKTKLIPIDTSDGGQRNASFSPEGRYVVYDSDTSDGQNLMVYRLETGSKFRLLSQSALNPRWSHDGNYIYYMTPTPSRLMRVPVLLEASGIRPNGISEEVLRGVWNYDLSSEKGKVFVLGGNVTVNEPNAVPDQLVWWQNWAQSLSKE